MTDRFAASPAARPLLIATTNAHKIREIRPLLADLPITVITLADVPPVPEPQETGATFWENARIKALAYAAATNHITVAEDSGLAVEALGGDPGVHSARFLGASASYPARFEELFRRLGSQPRAARFVTALAVALGSDILFETEAAVEGTIAKSAIGDHGFGYDPIFFFPPLGCTTAQLVDADKAAVSHRARAFRDLHAWLGTKSAIDLFHLDTAR